MREGRRVVRRLEEEWRLRGDQEAQRKRRGGKKRVDHEETRRHRGRGGEERRGRCLLRSKEKMLEGEERRVTRKALKSGRF